MRLIKILLLCTFFITCRSQIKAFEPVDLSGPWQFKFDQQNQGIKEKWYQDNKTDPWQKIKVPGSFNNTFRDSLWYQGKAWYKKSFIIPPEWPAGRLYLRFLGVVIRCKVWLNGKFLGEHLFPFTGFEFDISDVIQDGANLLTVQVDNKKLRSAIPDTKWNGWWDFGGITRQVYLEWRPDTFTKNVSLATAQLDKDKWELKLNVKTMSTASVTGSLDYAVEDITGKRIWHNKSSASFSKGITAADLSAQMKGIKAWSPKSPNLYYLKIKTRVPNEIPDVKRIRFGFREIKVQGTQIFLNGKPLLIKGISRHELYPGTGSTISAIRTKMDLQDIKDLGCNMIRTAHYTQHPLVYDLCDELGLLVWTEIPAWKTRTETLADDHVWKNYGAPQLQEMVEQNRNHPSIIVWSVGNEFSSDKAGTAKYVKRACNYVRTLDSTRLVTFASDKRERDICFDFVDVIAVNEYFGWYYGNIYDVGPKLDQLHQLWPGKPIMVSEFGSGSILGWAEPSPPDSGKDYSEDYQIKFLTTHLAQIYSGKRKFVAGGLIWNYADFADPHRIGSGHPALANYVNCKGLVTRNRQKKRAFAIVKNFYKNLK